MPVAASHGKVSCGWDDSLVIRLFCIEQLSLRFLRHQRVQITSVRDFPKTKLDSEINARFLLNKHGDPHFLFYKFNENNILNKREKHWQKSMATFLANEINATDREVTGPTEQVQIMFVLKDENIN